MAERAKIVITDFITGNLEVEREILGDIADIVAVDAHHEDELADYLPEADAVMVYHMLSLTAKSIARLERCKLIVRCGVGYDNVDHATARRRDIPVANVPDYGTEEVADSAIGMLLAMARGISFFNSRLRDMQGPWMYTQAQPIWRLRDRTFGIVGLGRIGGATALRAKALGMQVLFFDPFVPDGRDKSLGVHRVESFEELVSLSHVLSMHCPLTPESWHLVNRRTIELFRQGSFLVNTARGGVVETAAIPDAIASGRLAGAAIDVLEAEPPLNDPLVTAWRNPEHPAFHRVLINPHAAFYSEEGLTDMRRKGSAACRRALLGQPLRNVVNA